MNFEPNSNLSENTNSIRLNVENDAVRYVIFPYRFHPCLKLDSDSEPIHYTDRLEVEDASIIISLHLHGHQFDYSASCLSGVITRPGTVLTGVKVI